MLLSRCVCDALQKERKEACDDEASMASTDDVEDKRLPGVRVDAVISDGSFHPNCAPLGSSPVGTTYSASTQEGYIQAQRRGF